MHLGSYDHCLQVDSHPTLYLGSHFQNFWDDTSPQILYLGSHLHNLQSDPTSQTLHLGSHVHNQQCNSYTLYLDSEVHSLYSDPLPYHVPWITCPQSAGRAPSPNCAL